MAMNDVSTTRSGHAIDVEGLVRRFGETTALDGIDLQVPHGSVLGLLGPNGAGKTTAVRILATLLAPDAGHARVGGFDVVTQAHQVRQLIGLTGQYASVDESLTGTENLILIARLLGIPRDAARVRAQQLLAEFRLQDAADRAAKTYSGGMRRRLDLAASLVGNPRILFLDEPTTGLDPVARMDMWDLVRLLVADGVTVLLTTQYLDEADELADDLVVIDHGKVIASGTPDALKAQIGAQTLVVRPSQESDLARVAQVVAELTGTTPDVQHPRVTATVTDSAIVPAVVRRLDDESIALDELNLRTASLDEVFITLTGHRAEPTATEEEGALA
jgi:oleandomycin transport system ATP-binding protein